MSQLTNDAHIPNMIQELPWLQAMQAIRESEGFADFSAFRAHLEATLAFNSAYTRARYTQTILKYFFPESILNTFLCRVWKAYHDDGILEDLMRHQFLTQEPTVSQFVLTRLAPMSPGSAIDRKLLEEFVHEVDPRGREKMVDRLGMVLRRIGFLTREHRQDIVTQLKPSKTSLLLLIHDLFAPTPRIVTLAELLGHPFWRYLGLREEEIVRRILYEAGALGLIAGYANVDQLEQITTRYTLDQWLEQALRL